METKQIIKAIQYTLFGIALAIIQMFVVALIIDATDLIEFRFPGARIKYETSRAFVVGAAILLTMLGTKSKSKEKNISIQTATIVGAFGIGFVLLVIAFFHAFSYSGFRPLYINKSNPNVKILTKSEFSRDGTAENPIVMKAEPFLYYFFWLTPVDLSKINRDEWDWTYVPIQH